MAADQIEMPFEPDAAPRHPAEPQRRAGAAQPAASSSRASRSASSSPTRPGWCSAGSPATATSSATWTACCSRPGFSYAEKFVGTNGIGTALEVGGPGARVRPRALRREPRGPGLRRRARSTTRSPGRLVGAVDLTCWRKDAGPLLLTLAKTTAEQIRQALLADAGASQLGLLAGVPPHLQPQDGRGVRAEQRRRDAQRPRSRVLDPADQAALLAQATEALGRRPAPGTVVVELPIGSDGAACTAGVTVGDAASRRHRGPREARPSRQPPPATRTALTVRMPLPGLVGTSPPWLHVCQELERVFRAGEWLALEGEPGVGKLALLRAVQLRRQPVGRFVVLDAAEATHARADWLPTSATPCTSADTLVVRHVDPSTVPALRGSRLRAAGRTARAAGASAVGGGHAGATARQAADLLQLLRLFPSTVEVPPLRLHLEDLPLLVPLFLVAARPGRPPDLLARGDAAADADVVAGQRAAAARAAPRGRQAPAHRLDRARGPPARGAHGQPAACSARSRRWSATRSSGASTTRTATRPRRRGRWGCPGRRSTARSTSTASSPRTPDRRPDPV